MVSVVIPVYRAAAFVRMALDSALAQSEMSEVLLVEDGSPDDSLAVCKELRSLHSRVRLLRHPGGANRGARARRAISASKTRPRGMWRFLDADDYFLPGRFARDVALLKQDADIEGVYGVMGSVTDASYRGGNPHADSLTRVERGVLPERLFEEMGPLGQRGHFHINTLTV
jgi:glycosyltransferase involved in cell wall biosynthesis